MDDMDFKSYLNSAAATVDEQVELVLSEFLSEIKKTNPKLVPLALGLVNTCKGGKRIRGVLVKLGYEIGMESSDISRQSSDKEILKVGVAYEILHAALLNHDDIIDKSELRRGKYTLYKALGGDHYGISQALILGDIGLFLPVKLIASSNFPDDFKNKALSYFTQTVIDTGWGEALDVELGNLQIERKEADVLAIHKLKTAQYTISGPLIIGAILAGGSDELLEKLDEFGENLGIAFQIQDDILGCFGDEKALGKSVTSDIEEGKNTLLITYALEHSDKAQQAILSKFYGQGKIGKKELDLIKKVFLDTKSLDYSQHIALQYITRAKSIIPQISTDKKIQRILSEMATFLIERNK